MNNLGRRDALSVETTGDFDFVDYIPGDGLEHPVHSAVVMAWTEVGPVLEMVLEPPVNLLGFDGFSPSFCKYSVVIDPLEASGFPRDMITRLPVGSVVNVSLKYGPVYDPDAITFPFRNNGSAPCYLKQLRRLVKRENLLVGSLAWADQPADCWEEVESSFATGRAISVRVVDIGFNRETQKGGLVVQCGLLRGFVPGGLVDFRSKFYGMTLEQILRSLVGQTIKVKAIRVDREERQLIFSEVAAQDEIRRSQKADFLVNVRIGDQLMGFVTNIQPSLGIFVRVGECCDGLLRPDNLIGDLPQLHQPVTVEVVGVNLLRGHLNLRLDNTLYLGALDALDVVEEPSLAVLHEESSLDVLDEEPVLGLEALDFEIKDDSSLSVLDD